MFGAFWEGPNGLTGVPLGSISRSQFWGRFRGSLGRFGIPRAIRCDQFGGPGRALWIPFVVPKTCA